MRIAIVTAGGAGMFCGSCMHDNTWAAALRRAGHEVALLPTYTPLTLDETDQSEKQIFLGGINVYLEHKSRLWRKLPRFLTKWVDSPAIIRTATRFGVSNDASQLGDLTLDMLRGTHGTQRRDIEQLVAHLLQDFHPDAILFSNVLLSGVAEPLRAAFNGPIWGVVQGDDIFLKDLPNNIREEAIAQIRQNSEAFTGLLSHSDFYADFMSDMLSIPRSRFHRVPLGMSFDGHHGTPRPRDTNRFTVGYFARICPEKGLHVLLEAFQEFHSRHPNSRLLAGGYLNKRDHKYFQSLRQQYRGLGDAFHYAGSPATLAEKIDLIRKFDVLSVPTTWQEPKGLYVLEALANGVPVIQPAHGAFPEVLQRTGGGLQFKPDDHPGLVDALEMLYQDENHRLQLAHEGHTAVREQFSEARMVEATQEILLG